MMGSRIVALDFDPEPGYWQSQDGIALVQQCADYASQGATTFSVETQFSTIRPGETAADHRASAQPAPGAAGRTGAAR